MRNKGFIRYILCIVLAALICAFALFAAGCATDIADDPNQNTPVTPIEPENPNPVEPEKPEPAEPVNPPEYVPCGHSDLIVEQKRPATCAVVGYEKYWVCLGCGAMFSDEHAAVEITEPIIIPVISHTPSDKMGYNEKEHYYICSTCGNECNAVAHEFIDRVVSEEFLAAEATATSPALYYTSCACGACSDDTFVKYSQNILIGKPAYTDAATGAIGVATWGDGHRHGGLDYINDGDDMTRYNTAGGFGAPTVYFDLTDLYDLRGITLCQYDSRITAFKVYVSADENNWHEINDAEFIRVAEFTDIVSPNDCNAGGNNTREYADYLFDSTVYARYIKIEIVSAESNFTIWEIGAYGYIVDYGELQDIRIATPPTKTKYLAGNKFDASGMTVRAQYERGSKTIVDYSIDKTDELTEDDNAIIVSYTENGITKTAEVSISVSNLIPDTLSAKTINGGLYYGDSFKDGYSVSVEYKNGVVTDITDYNVDYDGPFGSVDNGKTVKLSYTEGDVTITLEVVVAVSEATDAHDNVAAGKTVTTSGTTGAYGTATWGDNHLYGGVEYLTDGNMDSRINSTCASPSYTIDLDNPFVIDRLGISEFDKNPFTFDLWTSLDGDSWNKVLENTAMRSPNDCGDLSLGRNTRDIVKFDFAPVEARYVKLDINAEVNISIWEILVYGELGDLGAPVELKITTPPNKTSYFVGDLFDPAGIVAEVIYEHGRMPVTALSFDKTSALTATDSVVTVSYIENGVTVTATVDIIVATATLMSIEAQVKSGGFVYGDHLKDGLIVTAVYTDMSDAVVKMFTVSYDGPLGTADNGKSFTVTYTENEITKTTEITVSVTEAPSAYDNVAAGKSVTTSGTTGGYGTAFWSDNHLYGGVEYLTDGNMDSRINSTSASVSYTIDLADSYSLNQLGLSAFDMKPFTFELYLSIDGENWMRVVESTAMRSPNDGNDASLGRNFRDIVKFDFVETAARYVRLDITATENISLWEISVYGKAV